MSTALLVIAAVILGLILGAVGVLLFLAKVMAGARFF